jgi:hypothetical protein
MTEPRPISTIIREILAEFPFEKLATEGAVSPATAEASREFKSLVAAQIENGEGYASKRAELREQAHLIPASGLQLEEQKARREAEDRGHNLTFETKRAFAKLETSLIEDALPKIDPARESLGRQELDIALGDGQPDAAALKLAGSGSREATAALLSPYGKTKLRALGVGDVDRVLSDAKKAAAAAGSGTTARERISGELVQKLSTVQGVAGSDLRHALNDDVEQAQRLRARVEQQYPGGQ